MKKFLIFALVIFLFTLLCIFFTEKTDVLSLRTIPFQASFAEDGTHLLLSWKRLPYPCFYKVEWLSKTTGLLEGEPEYRKLGQEFTFKSSYELPDTAIPMYYRITPYGMFGQLTGPSKLALNPRYAEPLSPVPVFHYSKENPASAMPFLVWHAVPQAVCYEVELLSGEPDHEGGTELSSGNHLYQTSQIYTNGWQADLTPYLEEAPVLYWRVRALGFHHEAIGEFSKAEPVFVNPKLKTPDHPLLNNFDRMPGFRQPLYPVYQWIPLHEIKRYEVELMTTPPSAENENNRTPSPQRVWSHIANDSFSCYDEYARPYAGEYYWRVRALDEDGQTIGSYSDVEEFIVESHAARVELAAFGDSITHGGGAISYSPANLEYSYTTYLDVSALNLGRSGDTSHTTMQRFEQDVLPYQPYNLLILTGSNSLRADTISADDVIADLEAIRRKCERNDIRPIFLTLMPINPVNIEEAFQTETDSEWQAKLRRINSYVRQQKYHIDLEPYFYNNEHSALSSGLSIDGLHPDIRGKMLMAEIINAHLSLLRKP